VRDRAIRTADAEWQGNLAQGSGHLRLGSGVFDGPYDFRSRMGDGKGTNPEELLAAAHAGCFLMALSAQLTQAGFTVERIHTKAQGMPMTREEARERAALTTEEVRQHQPRVDGILAIARCSRKARLLSGKDIASIRPSL
jgi:OsmC subfamily peroxiredoxin